LDSQNGIRDLNDLLTTEFGLDLAGWELTGATDISHDGKVIVGYGINPAGDGEAWVAVIPEPAHIGLLGMGLILGLRRKRRLAWVTKPTNHVSELNGNEYINGR
jgi:hypothetical protein